MVTPLKGRTMATKRLDDDLADARRAHVDAIAALDSALADLPVRRGSDVMASSAIVGLLLQAATARDQIAALEADGIRS